MNKKYIQLEERDIDGYWIYLKPGWKSDQDPIGCLHIIVENTKREAHQREALPCDCRECKEDLK